MKFLLEVLSRSPLWAIRPEAVPAAVRGLDANFSAGTWEAAAPSSRGTGLNRVAVIPIQGVLTKDGPAWYGSNYDKIGDAVSKAAANPDIKHIVLQVDSPGGEVTGLPETAAIIASAARQKPVTAMVDGTAGSAAYWLTSQARSVVLTPSGEVGSVGVRMMHVDVSQALENAGYKITELYSGEHKTEWSPYKPLSEEAVSAMQPRLEATHKNFLNAVQAGRAERLSQEMRQNRMGEGRMFSGTDALNHGLVDRLQSSRDFYASIVPERVQTDAFAPRHMGAA